MTAARETLRIVQTVHDTARDTVVRVADTHPSIVSAVAQISLAVAAIIVTVIFGLPTLWQWIENRLPPKVTVQLNLGAEEMVAPDRHNSWARSANKRYA